MQLRKKERLEQELDYHKQMVETKSDFFSHKLVAFLMQNFEKDRQIQNLVKETKMLRKQLKVLDNPDRFNINCQIFIQKIVFRSGCIRENHIDGLDNNED